MTERTWRRKQERRMDALERRLDDLEDAVTEIRRVTAGAAVLLGSVSRVSDVDDVASRCL